MLLGSPDWAEVLLVGLVIPGRPASAIFSVCFRLNSIHRIISHDTKARRHNSWHRGNTSRRQDPWRQAPSSRPPWLAAWRLHGSQLVATDLGIEVSATGHDAELGAIDLDAQLVALTPRPPFFPEPASIVLRTCLVFCCLPLAQPLQLTYLILESSIESIDL